MFQGFTTDDDVVPVRDEGEKYGPHPVTVGLFVILPGERRTRRPDGRSIGKTLGSERTERKNKRTNATTKRCVST